MTVRVERTFELGVPPEQVWEFIVDPERRASAISVVADYEQTGENTAIWHIKLPIPFLDKTVRVETEDVERDPPNYVKFVGRSSALRVTGEHQLSATEEGSRLVNRFTVDGRVPGVERYFQKQLDDELDNLEAAIREEAPA
ncbi:CoxG family protein [Halorussus litoreus]|uniref:CoxG family protein n=1 Tax=Halorussus litoreus TaxID=1710536 RepID=UPI000E279BF6|nr:SRPBCC family protein [Halorussus litoreus]